MVEKLLIKLFVALWGTHLFAAKGVNLCEWVEREDSRGVRDSSVAATLKVAVVKTKSPDCSGLSGR